MKRALAVLQSGVARTLFMLFAIIAAVWAIAAQWDAFVAALSQLSWWQGSLSLLASFTYVYLTMLSWRALLNGMGKGVPLKPAATIFFISQVAKYLPGGVWNFVAAAEAGVEYKVSRRRSVTVLLTSMLISILTGMVFAVLTMLFGPEGLRTSYGWTGLFLPILLVLLLPPVLNRLISMALRLLKREPLEESLNWGPWAMALVWSTAAWLIAGLQIWLILTALGMEESPATFFLATGGYALAWTVGFLVFFVPAGLGVREVVLGAVLAGYLPQGSVLAVVLLSRVLLTIGDLVLGVLASVWASQRKGNRSSITKQDQGN